MRLNHSRPWVQRNIQKNLTLKKKRRASTLVKEEKKREKVYLSQACQVIMSKEDFSYMGFILLFPCTEHENGIDVHSASMTNGWCERMNSHLRVMRSFAWRSIILFKLLCAIHSVCGSFARIQLGQLTVFKFVGLVKISGYSPQN